MEGTRQHITSADGVNIGLLTAGSGPGLLLVHGGMGTIESWRGVWDELIRHRRVTAMDRRGRGSIGDGPSYALDREFADVAVVASALAGDQGGPVDVAGHSIGATCVLGAAALGAPGRGAPGGHGDPAARGRARRAGPGPQRPAAELDRFLGA